MDHARYVALGHSFTEGVGDADPTRPNGLRGWADRVAEVLAARTPDFGYANLAIRGRKLLPILEEQLDPTQRWAASSTPVRRCYWDTDRMHRGPTAPPGAERARAAGAQPGVVPHARGAVRAPPADRSVVRDGLAAKRAGLEPI